MNVKLVVTLAVVAFALFMVVTEPTSAANAVHAALRGVTSVFKAFATFISSL